MTSSYNRGELDFDMNEFNNSSAGLFLENSAGYTATDGLYGDLLSVPVSAEGKTDPFFDYSAMAATADNSFDWLSSPDLSISSSSAPWTTSPTFSNDLDLNDASYLNEGAVSPINLTEDTWPPTAQKHEWFPDNDDTCTYGEEADSPPPAKKSRVKKSSSKSSTTSQGRTQIKTEPGLARKSKSRKSSSPSTSTRASPRPSSPEDDLASTTGDRKARHNHNVIEKQYRSRLNAQFERLLAALPESQRTSDGRAGLRGAAASDSEDKRMSKAEVLELARRRIYALEQERRDLQAERSRILESVGIVRRAMQQQQQQQQWVGSSMN